MTNPSANSLRHRAGTATIGAAFRLLIGVFAVAAYCVSGQLGSRPWSVVITSTIWLTVVVCSLHRWLGSKKLLCARALVCVASLVLSAVTGQLTPANLTKETLPAMAYVATLPLISLGAPIMHSTPDRAVTNDSN